MQIKQFIAYIFCFYPTKQKQVGRNKLVIFVHPAAFFQNLK